MFFSYTNGLILSGYLSLLALQISGTPSLMTGTSPPSCLLLDNHLFIFFVTRHLVQSPFLTVFFGAISVMTFFMLVLHRRTSFWPPSMVYISVQCYTCYKFPFGPLRVASIHVLHYSCLCDFVGSPMASVMMCFIMSHVLTVIEWPP